MDELDKLIKKCFMDEAQKVKEETIAEDKISSEAYDKEKLLQKIKKSSEFVD